MKTFAVFGLGAMVTLCAISIIGCGSGHQSNRTETSGEHHAGVIDKEKQQANFAKLSAEDRPLAEAQGYCAVTSEPLGSMGAPLKLIVNDQAVFVCCKGCEKKAKSNPEQTLAKAAELKAKVQSEHQK